MMSMGIHIKKRQRAGCRDDGSEHALLLRKAPVWFPAPASDGSQSLDSSSEDLLPSSDARGPPCADWGAHTTPVHS